jgi:hypothetical protein
LNSKQEPRPVKPAAPPTAGVSTRRALLDIRHDLESLYRLLKD